MLNPTNSKLFISNGLLNALRLVRDKVVAGIFDLEQIEQEEKKDGENMEMQELENGIRSSFE
jgi:hypothetical protein